MDLGGFLQLPLKAHQAFGVSRILSMESRRRGVPSLGPSDHGTANGGINGDEMGVGKTLQMIVLIICSALLEERCLEVRKTRVQEDFWTALVAGKPLAYLPSNEQFTRLNRPA